MALATVQGPLSGAAVERLNNQAILFKVATTAKNRNIRQRASEHIVGQERLLSYILSVIDSDVSFAVAATAKIESQWLTKIVFESSRSQVRLAAVRRISSERDLVKVVQTTADREVRSTALQGISTDAVLAELIVAIPQEEIARAFFSKPRSSDSLRLVATTIDKPGIRLAARILLDEDRWDAAFEAAVRPSLIGRTALLTVTEAATLVPASEDIASNARSTSHKLMLLGDESRVSSMIILLGAFGDRQLAEEFLNCGHPRLESEAAEWARKKGFQIQRRPGSKRTGWGGK